MSKETMFISLEYTWLKGETKGEHVLVPLGGNEDSDNIALILNSITNGYYAWVLM